MKLYESMMEACTVLDKTSVSDGMGGYSIKWVDGAKFNAVIVKDNTTQGRIAAKQGVTELYTVTVQKGMPLDFHDVFRRDSDGAVFRVTSNIKDSETPAIASFQIGQVSAERWDPA